MGITSADHLRNGANLPSEQRQPSSPFPQVHSHVSRHFRSPDTRNKSFRPRHVGRVLVTKFLEHHSLFIADPKREENPKRDQIRRTSNPIRKDKHLAKQTAKKDRVHRVADALIDAMRDQLMMFTGPKRAWPV